MRGGCLYRAKMAALEDFVDNFTGIEPGILLIWSGIEIAEAQNLFSLSAGNSFGISTDYKYEPCKEQACLVLISHTTRVPKISVNPFAGEGERLSYVL